MHRALVDYVKLLDTFFIKETLASHPIVLCLWQQLFSLTDLKTMGDEVSLISLRDVFDSDLTSPGISTRRGTLNQLRWVCIAICKHSSRHSVCVGACLQRSSAVTMVSCRCTMTPPSTSSRPRRRAANVLQQQRRDDVPSKVGFADQQTKVEQAPN